MHLIYRPNFQCYFSMMSRIVAFLGHYVKGITWKIGICSVYILSFCGRNGEGYFCICSTDVISGDNRVRSMNSIVRCLFYGINSLHTHSFTQRNTFQRIFIVYITYSRRIMTVDNFLKKKKEKKKELSRNKRIHIRWKGNKWHTV